MQHCDYQEQEPSPGDTWELGLKSPREYTSSDIWKQARPDGVEFTRSTSWLKAPCQRSESIIHDRRQINRSFQQWISDLAHKSEQLQDVKDEDGSPIVARASMDRSLKFLEELFNQALGEFGIEINIPDILPGPNQSVDLLWAFSNYELLVNVPANAIAKPTYYGDNRGENVTKGSISTPDSVRRVWLWLVCQKQ